MQQWDVICHMVDNFGDIGICWRLARQLSAEHQINIRLLMDKPDVAQHIIPQLQAHYPQTVQGVTIELLSHPHLTPSPVVIVALGAQLPMSFLAHHGLLIIQLEYLSAEKWVVDFHTRPSPRTDGMTRFFFFPSFFAQGGGLLRESTLIQQRNRFLQQNLPHFQGIYRKPHTHYLSLFCYPHAPLMAFYLALSQLPTAVHVLLPTLNETGFVSQYAHLFSKQESTYQRDNLSVSILPFLAQDDYDRLLWWCDFNFVRGEDSWIRAIWAGKPFVWHAYPQENHAHHVKLAAFLDYACQNTPAEIAHSWHSLHNYWNAIHPSPPNWQDIFATLPILQSHTQDLAQQLAKLADLASQLVAFVRQHAPQ